MPPDAYQRRTRRLARAGLLMEQRNGDLPGVALIAVLADLATWAEASSLDWQTCVLAATEQVETEGQRIEAGLATAAKDDGEDF